MTNKYKGNCTLCGTEVAANQGEYDWKRVWCSDCAAQVAKPDRLRLLEAIAASWSMGDDDDYDHEDPYVIAQYFGHDGTDTKLPLIPVWKQTPQQKAEIATSNPR